MNIFSWPHEVGLQDGASNEIDLNKFGFLNPIVQAPCPPMLQFESEVSYMLLF